MTSDPHAPLRTCRILDAEPDLADGLSATDRQIATRALVAPVRVLVEGRWEPPPFDPRRTFGLLVLEGLLGRRVRVGSAVATELLGPGDILRPWDEPELWGMIPPELDWRVFGPTRLAILDEHVTRVIGRRPELIVNFSSRLLRRARSVAYLMAISHRMGVEEKVMATLWHIASNWGRVTPAGVSIPFRLTHGVLGEIIGAQRPSITLALGRLVQQGRVVRDPVGAFILTEDPAATDEAVPASALLQST